MKKTITSRLLAAVLIGMFMLAVQKTEAQTIENVGYMNLYAKIVATPQGGGKVCATESETGLKTYKDEFEFKKSVLVQRMSVDVGGNVGSLMYTGYYVHARPTDGWILNGWYEDTDGNGEYNSAIDKLGSNGIDYLVTVIVDEDTEIYPTKEAAAEAEFPETPQVVFASFTRGAMVGVSYYQGENQVNCGSVFIDKEQNEPGDVVTVRAIPNDGYKFAYWENDRFMGDVVSTENPYTFTVEGGEKLYAYFMAIDAPSIELPEEGGFMAFCPNKTWVLSDEDMKKGAHILVLEAEDLTKTDDGKIYLDMSKEDTWIDVAQQNGYPTIVYGKGKVQFAYQLHYGINRAKDPLVRWSGNGGATLTGENAYVYVFEDELGAFIQYANTDVLLNPNTPTQIKIEPNRAFFWMSSYDLANFNGEIPTVIGLSPETFDKAVAGVEGVTVNPVEVKGKKIYTLSGVEVKATDTKGVYIINGKKVLVK